MDRNESVSVSGNYIFSRAIAERPCLDFLLEELVSSVFSTELLLNRARPSIALVEGVVGEELEQPAAAIERSKTAITLFMVDLTKIRRSRFTVHLSP